MDDIKLELSASPNTVWSFRNLIGLRLFTLELLRAFDMQVWLWISMRGIYPINFHIWTMLYKERNFIFTIGFLFEWLWRTIILQKKNNWEKHHCTIILLLFWILLTESELYKKSNHRADCHHLCKIMTEPRFYSQLFILGVYYLLSYNGNQLILRLKWGRNIFFA